MKKIEAALAIIRHFIQTDPSRAAEAMETLQPADAVRILELLPEAAAAAALESQQPQKAARLMARLPVQLAAALVQRLSPRHAAAVFSRMPERSAKRLVALLPKGLAAGIAETLAYPVQSAGRLMHGDFLSFRAGLRVEEVIERLRQLAHGQVPLSYCYVVDEAGRLVGVLNMRDLLLAEGETLVEAVMRTKVIKVSPFTDREELVALFSKKHYITVPVADNDGKLLGVVPTASIIESTEEEASEDIQILFGASAEERISSSPWFKITRRLPWLTVNLATAFLAGSVVALFEDFIARIAVLAVFLPIIAGQGGNAGTQTLVVVLRGMIMREIAPHNAWQLVRTEVFVGFINGLATGLITATAAWLWKGNAWLGLVVGLAMVVNMVAAGLAGALIPVLMKRMGYDPAHSSGIFLTTVTDVVGFFAFLSTAWLLQGKLI